MMFEQDADVFLFYSPFIEMITRLDESAAFEAVSNDEAQTDSDARIKRIEELQQVAKRFGATFEQE